jgi:hypothetical protein
MFVSQKCHFQNPVSNSQQINSETLSISQEPMRITYEASTRGFYEKIWITKDTISFSTDRSLKTVTTFKCHKEDWDSILELTNILNLNILPTLNAPTNMRQVDGAAMATLKIELQNEVYKTNIFDHGHPPKTIAELVNKVLSIKEMLPKQ